MNEKSKCINILEGNEYRLKLGHIGVVCRSQDDIDNNKKLNEA